MFRLDSLQKLLALAALFAGLSACDRAPSKPTPAAPSPEKAVTQQDNTQTLAEFLKKDAAPDMKNNTALPPGHPPVPPASTKATTPSSAALNFDPPDTWEAQPLPPGSMRKAHYFLPRAEGDTKAAELIVFYFGAGQGGSVEANLQRWKDMFVGADGKKLSDEASKVENFTADGMKVTVLEVTGRYVDSNMMTGQKSDPTSEDFNLLGGIVEAPSGAWFFKALGPAASMSRHRQALHELLRNVRQ